MTYLVTSGRTAFHKNCKMIMLKVILPQGVLRRASKLFWRSSGRTTLQNKVLKVTYLVTKLFAVLQVLMGELFGHKW